MTSSVNAELFAITASTPADGRRHGAATASGRASASAALERGLDLSARVEIGANVDASIRDEVSGTFTGGVAGKGGVALQAKFPLDLFREAGIVARVQAQAEAGAYLRATLGLELQAFRDLVRGQFEGPLRELCDIFLEEAVVEAGLWARAAFAAEIVAEATLTGSLVSSGSGSPGFSFSAEYGMGLLYGSGASFLANIGFTDPRRLLNRLSDRLTALVVAEAERHVATLSGPDRDAAAEALTILRILLPLAGRSAFELGVLLAWQPPQQHKDAAARSVVRSFVGEAQELLLRHVFDLGLTKVRDLLGGESTRTTFDGLTGEAQDRVRSDLLALKDAVVRLDALEHARGSEWLDAVVACLEATEALVEHGLIEGSAADEIKQALALAWSAAVLVDRAAAWAEQAAGGQLFPSSLLAPVPNNSTVGAHVAAAIAKPAGSGLTLADLVTFMVGVDLVAELRAMAPAVADTIDWLEAALAALPDQDLVHALLVSLTAIDQQSANALLASMGEAFGQAIHDRVLPDLILPIQQADPQNQALAALLDDVVAPTLTALPGVVLEHIPDLGSEDAGRRFREALSAVLLQSLGQFLMATVDVLLAHALDQGTQSLREASEAVGQFGEQSPGFSLIASAAAGAVLPVTPTPADVRDLLALCADIVQLWNDHEREPVIRAASELLRLGLDSDATRGTSLATIVGSDGAPRPVELERLFGQIEEGIWRIGLLVVPRTLELVGAHFLHEIELVAKAIYDGARALVSAIEAGIAWLGQQLDLLEKKLEQLAAATAQLVADIAGTVSGLADALLELEDQIVQTIRADGWALAGPLVSWAPGFVRGAVHDLYDAAFDSLTWLLEAPLQVLRQVAQWVHDALAQQIAAGAFSRAGLEQAVRNGIYAAAAADLTVELQLDLGLLGKYDFGSITIGAGHVLGTIAGTVLGEASFAAAVETLLGKGSTLRATQAQHQATQSAHNQALTKQQAQETVGSLTTGQPLQIGVNVAAGSVHAERVKLTITVDGANRSFVESPLGVPRRIRLFLNGAEYVYAPEQWLADTTKLTWSAYVVPEPFALLPQPAQPPYRFDRLRLPPGAVLQVQDVGAVGQLTLDVGAVPAGPGPAPALGPQPHAAAGDPDRAHLGRIGLGGEPFTTPDVIDVPMVQGGSTTITADQYTVVIARPTGARPASAWEQAVGWGWGLIAVDTGEPIDPTLPVIVGQRGVNVVQVAASDGKDHLESAGVTFILKAGEEAT